MLIITILIEIKFHKNINNHTQFCKGWKFCKLEDFDPNNNPWKGLPRYNQPKKKKISKPNELKNKIICLETEEVKTVEEWAKIFKCHKATIYNSLKGNKTRLRNHFCFLED